MSLIAATSSASISTHLPQAGIPEPRLVQAAREFEAQMMKELLQPLTNLEGEDGDDWDAGSGGALADFSAEALGESLSARGGLGIATSIVRSLSHDENSSRSAPKQGNTSAFLTAAAVAPFK